MIETQKDIDDHEKEIARRMTLKPHERLKLDREDQEKTWKKRVAQAEKVEARIKDRAKLASSIQNDITALATKLAKFTEQDVETYEMLLDPDCLFNDSPMGALKTYHWASEFMVKKDMDGIVKMYIPDGKPSIKPFVERMEEASNWAMRFVKPTAQPKRGLDAIIEED
jgi:hypothetical protein